MMESLQKLGKALMGAVTVMPVAALLMGIGYWIDPTGWGANNLLAAVLIKSGGAVLDNLGYIFAVAIAFVALQKTPTGPLLALRTSCSASRRACWPRGVTTSSIAPSCQISWRSSPAVV